MLIKKIKGFPLLLSAIFILFGIVYLFSYVFPFTSNAFVVADITPVAANISGFITDIYIKNSENVKKGTPLFKIFQAPYQFTYAKSVANYNEGLSHLVELKNLSAKNEAILAVAKTELAKTNYDYQIKANPLVADAVPTQERKDLSYQRKILTQKINVIQQQLKIDDAEIKQQLAKIASLKAEVGLAKTNLDLTVIKAPSDGIVDNMYVNNGTQVSPNQPLFSFINTADFYIQANFNEIDLRNVRRGDRVLILPRVYLGSKSYHGVVIGDVWNVNRQETMAKNQLQTVTQNENNWILLPQRLPVQIKITDYDPVNYPLSVGSSCYVYIKTHTH